jgi:hypothetical protein
MSSLWNPPALAAIGLVVTATAAAYWHGLGPLFRRSRSGARIEAEPSLAVKDEMWGTDEPPLPSKGQYTWPSVPQPVSAPDEAESQTMIPPVPATAIPVRRSRLVPIAGGAATDHLGPGADQPEPEKAVDSRQHSPAVDHQSALEQQVGKDASTGTPDETEAEEREPSLADFFRSRRHVPHPQRHLDP